MSFEALFFAFLAPRQPYTEPGDATEGSPGSESRCIVSRSFWSRFFQHFAVQITSYTFFCPHDMSQAGIKLSRPREPEMVGTDAIGFFRFHDFMNSWVNLCPTDWVNPSGPSLLARLSG